MRRRELISALLLVGGSLRAWGQQPERTRRVGLLTNSGPTTSWRGELLDVLRQHGFELGKNLELAERNSDRHTDRLPQLARELDAMGLDAILATTLESGRATLAVTRTTPIVMVVGDDPVALGIVTSLARPGGRVTGIVFQTPEGDAKRLQLLSEAIPEGRRFGYLGMSFESGSHKVEAVTHAADQLGVALITRLVDGPAEYGTAFAAMRKDGAAGVVIGENQPMSSDSTRVVKAAEAESLPAICGWDYMARQGCILGFGHDLANGQRRAAEYIARILKGVAPSDLPVERIDAWKLTVNLKAAKQLGLTIPPAVLVRADEVIE